MKQISCKLPPFWLPAKRRGADTVHNDSSALAEPAEPVPNDRLKACPTTPGGTFEPALVTGYDELGQDVQPHPQSPPPARDHTLSRLHGEKTRISMHRSPITLRLLTIGLILTAAGSSPLGAQPAQLYVRQPTLQQTLLDTRARLQTFETNQQQGRSSVQIGPWYVTRQQPNEALTDLLAAAAQVPPENNAAVDQRWTPLRRDNSDQPVLTSVSADFLITTITSTQPTTLTLELSHHEKYGGFAYRPGACRAGVDPAAQLVWVNGQPLAMQNRLLAYPQTTVAQRRGWHDLILVDLPLAKGRNQITISLHKGPHKSWFNAISLTPHIAPAIWALLEHDFPRTQNQLLDSVSSSWFEPHAGWLANRCTELEEELISQLATALGDSGQVLRIRLSGLQTQHVDRHDPRWLDLCVTAAELHSARHSLDALAQAVSELGASYPQRYPLAVTTQRISDLREAIVTAAHDQFDPADPRSAALLRDLARLKHDALVTTNPLLAGRQLLFIKRHTYDSDHYYDEFIAGLRHFGSQLCLLSIDDGTITELIPECRDGVIDRYDMSFDAQRVLFSYKPPRPEGFRIYELDLQDRSLRQVTHPPADELDRINTFATCSTEQLAQQQGRYGHWTDDMHPCYLPDGDIVFTSTRSRRSVLCGGHGLTVTNLYRTSPDGSNLHQLSQGALSEFCPSVMNDGRVLYNRWEYVDKGAGAVQSLWAMCPDGSRSEEVYGNNITTPGVFNQAHHVPGKNNLIVALGAAHCPGNIGAIVLIDMLKDKRSPSAMTALTPGSVPEGNWGLRQYRNGRWITDIHGPWYCDPYPLSDHTHAAINGRFFLVSCNVDREWNDPAAYGLCLLDVYGNRVPIYDAPDTSCWQARPWAPRPRPPVLTDPPALDVATSEATATMVVADVYQGLPGVPRGAVKYLRVMEQIPRPWSVYLGYQPDDRAPGQMVAVSLYTHLSVKVLHGVVPVHEDGSAYFTVPADRNIFLQALDKDYMEIQRMRTFVNFQPGERRSCIGCHEPRSQAPLNRPLLALQNPPNHPAPQPGETAPRPLHYPTDIQPILDTHCTSCHGAEQPDGDLNLTGTMTALFSQSYENMINRDLVGYIQEFIGPKPEGADAMGYAESVPPFTYGSHHSKLIQLLHQGHYDVRLSPQERVRLTTWVDANAPYYGSYFGRRNLTHRDDPDFRPVPTLDSARGIRNNN